jgi:hypothetical protein
MNENDLRLALRDTMATAPEPPPMNETIVLDAAERAERRRRARWAGAGSAIAAVAVVGVAVVVVTATSGAAGPGALGPGGGHGSTTSATSSGTSSSARDSTQGSTSGTKPDWPDGQTDATATSGPQYEKGRSLLEMMVAVVPTGYETPRGLPYTDGGVGTLDMSQAAWDGKNDGVDVWDYYATLPLAKGNRMGELLIDVQSPGNPYHGAACALGNLWEREGTCVERSVDGQRVGLWTGSPGELERCAGYKHDDGTVVWACQSFEFAGSGRPRLTALPYTDKQLMRLATEEEFRLH